MVHARNVTGVPLIIMLCARQRQDTAWRYSQYEDNVVVSSWWHFEESCPL